MFAAGVGLLFALATSPVEVVDDGCPSGELAIVELRENAILIAHL